MNASIVERVVRRTAAAYSLDAVNVLVGKLEDYLQKRRSSGMDGRDMKKALEMVQEIDLHVGKLMRVGSSVIVASVNNPDSEDEFVVTSKLKLKSEGSTRVSIENAQLIKEAGYVLRDATMTFDKNHGKYSLMAVFGKPFEQDEPFHVFKGFSFGYGGEGPRGFMEFGKLFGVALNAEKVMTQMLFEKVGNSGSLSIATFVGA